jgi:predicted small metal-binding protein
LPSLAARIVNKVLRCECGFAARAEDEEGLVAEVQRHAWEAHGMALTHDEALVLSLRAQLGATAPPTISRETGYRTEEEER